jgi:integrase
VATITPIKNAKGITYRAQIRKFKGGELIYSEARTFDTRALARSWAATREPQLTPAEMSRNKSGVVTVGDLLAKYEAHYCSEDSRSKTASVRALQLCDFAQLPLDRLTSGDLIAHAHERLQTVKPQTVLNDFIWISQAYEAAYPTWGIKVDRSEVDAAMSICRKQGLIHKSDQRERRPTEDEMQRLDAYFDERNGWSAYPMRDIMWFAVFSARREAEITRLMREDNDAKTQTGIVRDLKHPRRKKGNHKKFKYTPEAWKIAERQPKSEDGRIFPYDAKTIGAYFRQACAMLEIHDLRFHDLRHEATSRLFEAGYSIPEVQLFTLHQSWSTLQRYVNLRPENLKIR